MWESIHGHPLVYRDLSKASQVSLTSLSNIIHQRGEIRRKTINRLCAFFHCKPGDLYLYVDDDEFEQIFGPSWKSRGQGTFHLATSRWKIDEDDLRNFLKEHYENGAD